MTVLTEGRHPGEFIVNEAPGTYCRDAIVIAAGEGNLPAGAVVGREMVATASAKSGGNAPNTGALTLDPTMPALPGARAGVYRVRCVATAAGGGTFRVTDPSGADVGDLEVGDTFDEQVKFTIAAGSQDFAEDEGFDIAVVAGKFRSANPSRGDASTVAKGIILYGVDATNADKKVAAFVRGPAEVNGNCLVYDAAVDTAPKKAAKIAELAAVGIVVR